MPSFSGRRHLGTTFNVVTYLFARY